jgi:hypothetical protein
MYEFLCLTIKKTHYLKLKIIAYIFLKEKTPKLIIGMAELLLKGNKHKLVQALQIKIKQL